MSLPVKNLDDRTFQQLVDEAKGKIPELCPGWTNHNVADPGIALIELFAWMTEMAIFRLNQVPDVFYTRMLNMLEFPRFPAEAAQTDLTFWLTRAVPSEYTIPAGTEVETVGGTGEQVIFSTVADVVIDQPECVAAYTQSSEDGPFVDVLSDLDAATETVPCFAPATSPTTTPTPDERPLKGACFYLGFETSLAGHAINVTITTPRPTGIGIKPSDPPFVWEVWSGTGWQTAKVPEHDHIGGDGDTTGGLNRSGTVLILIPKRHHRSLVNNVSKYWLRAHVTRQQPDGDHQSERIGYERSPELQTLAVTTVGAVARAEHSARVVNEVLGVSNGKPGQTFILSHHPIIPFSPPDDDTTETTPDEPAPTVLPVHIEAGIAVHEGSQTPEPIYLGDDRADGWKQVSSFADSGEFSRHYVVDATTGELRLGPGIRYPGEKKLRQHGMVPPSGARILMREYRHGGGVAGNVGPATLTGLRETLKYVEQVTNLEAAKGGVDAETVEQAKQRAPLWVRGGDRAVTAHDFERLAREAHPGVARSHCRSTFETGEAVRLLLIPQCDKPSGQLELDDLDLTTETRDAVANYLEERRVLGTTVEIGTPYYQGVSVVVLVNKEAKAAASADAVRNRVESALYGYIDPIRGGLHGTGWEFNREVSAAGIAAVVEALDGVGSVEQLLLFDQDPRLGRRMGSGKETIKLETDTLPLSGQHRVVVR